MNLQTPSSNRQFFTLGLFVLLLPVCGCVSTKSNPAPPLPRYPSADLVIPYHSEWAKNHYKERILAFQKDPLNTGEIVFVGNSITEQGGDWGVRTGVTPVRNRGISGDVTDGVLLRLGEITEAKPNAIFLLIGINDLFNLDQNRGIISPEYVGKNIVKIAATIRAQSPKTKLYIQTLLPTANERMKENILVVNEWIKAQAKQEKYTVIDLYPLFINETGLMRDNLTTDGTHLNKAGYDVWVDLVRPEVMRYGIPSK